MTICADRDNGRRRENPILNSFGVEFLFPFSGEFPWETFWCLCLPLTKGISVPEPRRQRITFSFINFVGIHAKSFSHRTNERTNDWSDLLRPPTVQVFSFECSKLTCVWLIEFQIYAQLIAAVGRRWNNEEFPIGFCMLIALCAKGKNELLQTEKRNSENSMYGNKGRGKKAPVKSTLKVAKSWNFVISFCDQSRKFLFCSRRTQWIFSVIEHRNIIEIACLPAPAGKRTSSEKKIN